MDSHLAIYAHQNVFDLARLPFRDYLKQYDLLVKHLGEIAKARRRNARRR